MEYQKSQKFKKIHKKIIQRQLQMRMIKNYLEWQKIIDNLATNVIV